MKYIFYSLIAGSLILACNNRSGEKPAGETIVEVDQPARECYSGNSGKDSVMISLERNEDGVSGNLSYKFFEKDSNHGTIVGTFHGDTLLAHYNFAAEGSSSVRQVAFLKKDNQLLEGYGDMEEKEGVIKFKSPASLSFGKGFILNKVECK